MIPAGFDYVRAATVADALRLLAQHKDEARLLAGGHTLIPALKLRLAAPGLLIDIAGIAELKGIEIGPSIRIGALATHWQILACEPLGALYPVFREAAEVIADPLVRNRGTIGGALANADPGADWPAVVLALAAEIELAGPQGRRRVAARDFFLDVMTTALAPGEILAAVHIPRPAPGTRAGYRKIRHPASGYAVVGVAARLAIEGDRIAAAGIGVTGATPCPFAATDAAAVLIGKRPSAALIAAAAAAAAADRPDYLADRYAPAAYRRHVLGIETQRLLTALLSGTTQEKPG